MRGFLREGYTCIEAGIEHRILDVIQRHSPRSVAEGYGEVTIKTQAAAIAKLHIPRYYHPPNCPSPGMRIPPGKG